jgi:hypothetical protein
LQAIVWDFGVLTPGVEKKHQFTITNRSAIPWRIKFVTSTCSCTVGEFSSKTVKPSESTSVEISFRAPTRETEVSQALLVEFAEPEAPLFHLGIKGEIRNPLSAVPAGIDFGTLAADTPLRQTVELRNYSSEDFAITRVETPPWLQADCRPAETGQATHKPRQTWQLVVRADLSKRPSKVEPAKLLVHTNSQQVGSVEIPVTFREKGPLDAKPDHLRLNPVEPGKITHSAVMIEVAPELGDLSEKDLVVTHNLGEELNVAISRTGSPRRFMLVGYFRPVQSNGKVEGELQIKTKGPKPVSFKMKVTGEVR